MIFVTVGTHQQPFTRLLESLDQLPGDQLVVQHGYGPPPEGVARAVPFVSFREMVGLFEEAERVVTHAGVGSVLLARRTGHVPVVVPRLQRYREHVDDHQLQLIRALSEIGHVIPVFDTAELAQAVASAPARGEPTNLREGRLHEALRTILVPAGDRSEAGR
jgi:UDP-N-acetylglucosamine transferase subunit ALG13